MVKVRGNAGERRSWPLIIAGSFPRPHTAVNGTGMLRGAPSAYSRAPNFFRVPVPQVYTSTTAACAINRVKVLKANNSNCSENVFVFVKCAFEVA